MDCRTAAYSRLDFQYRNRLTLVTAKSIFEAKLDGKLSVRYSRVDERLTQSDYCRSADLGCDQSRRDGISAREGRVGTRDGGNRVVPHRRDTCLCRYSLALRPRESSAHTRAGIILISGPR